MEVSYEWAKGVPFSKICQLTDIQEGSIVRSITQIDQALREVKNCARVIGDSDLYKKMEVASSLIKRDIVFAASLYVV
jgi:antiviral helicase SKI2